MYDTICLFQCVGGGYKKTTALLNTDNSTASSEATEFHEAWTGKQESSSSTTTTSWMTVMRPIVKLFDGVNPKTLVFYFTGTQMIIKLNTSSPPSGTIMPQHHDTVVSTSSPQQAPYGRRLEDATRILERDLMETSTTVVASTPGVRGARI